MLIPSRGTQAALHSASHRPWSSAGRREESAHRVPKRTLSSTSEARETHRADAFFWRSRIHAVTPPRSGMMMSHASIIVVVPLVKEPLPQGEKLHCELSQGVTTKTEAQSPEARQPQV